MTNKTFPKLLICAFLILAAVLISLVMPQEKTLGSSIRLIYFHGAWVWTGILLFAGAGLLGLAATIWKKESLYAWCRAAGLAGLFYWLTYLPMSLWVMKASWGGFYFDEPRWRVPFTFAIVGTLLQLGLWLMNNKRITAIANTLFAVALLFSLASLTSILHPESPILQSDSGLIKILFLLLFTVSFAGGIALAAVIQSWLKAGEKGKIV